MDNMKVKSITEAIKVVKENDIGGVDMYIDSGDKLQIVDIEGKEYVGRFMFVEWGVDVDEDDILIFESGDGKQIEVGASYVENIDIL